MTERLKDAALRYADRGWQVFPLYGIVNGRCECGVNCGSPGKHPRTKQGFKDATDNPEVIESWWTRWPTANIGVATGKQSGIYVVDLDNKRSVDLGNGELIGEGEHSIRQVALSSGSQLPETMTSQTGSGGIHLIFTYPTSPQSLGQGITFGNRAGVLPSVDTRGDGGYIVAPPSLHQSGSRYRWVEEDQPPVPLTSTWLSVLTATGESTSNLSLELPPDFSVREGEGRHEWLFKMGSKLRGQHGLPYVALFGSLSAYNSRHLSPPLQPREVEHIVESCMKFDPGTFSLPVDTSDIAELHEGDDLAELLADFMANEPDPFVPLVAKLLNSGEAMVLGGPPNIGKTWAVLDMMMGISSGTDFANYFHCSQGPVLFVDEEGSRRGDWERFSMLLRGRGRSSVEFPIFTKIDSGIKIDDPRGHAALARLIERYRPSSVFLDSLVRMHGRDESNNRDMANFFEVVKRLMVNYGTAFVFTHHIRKPAGDGKADPLWMLRGASDIQGFPDSIGIMLPGEDTSEIEFIHTKMRNGEKLPTFGLKLWIDPNEGEARIGHIPHDPLSKANRTRDAILAAIRVRGESTPELVAAETGLSVSTIVSHAKVLAQTGAMTTEKREGTWWYQVPMGEE